MRFLDEYRDVAAVQALAERIRRELRGNWRIMEVCGGQTHSIVRYGLDQLLPPGIELIHGPGCPVCVTPVTVIDQALTLAARPEIILCSFGDMLRVPGSRGDLLSARAEGGDVRVVYSPLDAVALAVAHPDRQVVFFAVGFETTAPAVALALLQAQQRGLGNFFALVSHVLVPPAIEAILSSPQTRVDGFLAAGHVCAVMGTWQYQPLVDRYRVPIVVTGFEPLDILQGIGLCVRQLEDGRAELENQYRRVVRDSGNQRAQQMVEQVFEVGAQCWRGIGELPDSGLFLREAFAAHDAARRFPQTAKPPAGESECIGGQILQGLSKPRDCPAFGVRCTPERPLGAPMVSSEGACAAYYRYRQHG